MSGVDVHISINNVPQFERNQSESQRAPLVFQGQNSQIARDELHNRIKVPVAPEKSEGKRIDPKDRKKEEKSGKKSAKNKKDSSKHNKGKKSRSDEGFFVDLQA
ncbi:hypothetical protein CHISP_2452 [Chitinispirillum alkaliphilum]|nr:hypothetical protein CHISP_2452 [Chitinispirillum alkaliphilum]